MGSGTALRHSRHLAGPPPLGETTSHIDSHTMGDHEDEIPKMSSPPHEVGDVDSTLVYDP